MTTEATKKQKPHIALTHLDKQGGSANGRNVSLLLKSDAEIDEETAQLIEKLSGVKVEVNKASYQSKMDKLAKGVEKFKDTSWEWSYVVDFDDTFVVFSNNSGYWAAEYSESDNIITVSNEATEVSRFVSYVEESGKVALTEVDKTLEGGVLSLVVKSLEKINEDEKLTDIFKTMKKEKLMEKDIEKAVNERTEVLKADLEKAQTDLQEALAEVQKMQDKAKEVVTESRKSALGEVISDEAEVETLLKSVVLMDEDVFQVMLKSMKASKKALEGSDLFNRESTSVDIEKADAVPDHVAILKEKYKAAE